MYWFNKSRPYKHSKLGFQSALKNVLVLGSSVFFRSPRSHPRALARACGSRSQDCAAAPPVVRVSETQNKSRSPPLGLINKPRVLDCAIAPTELLWVASVLFQSPNFWTNRLTTDWPKLGTDVSGRKVSRYATTGEGANYKEKIRMQLLHLHTPTQVDRHFLKSSNLEQPIFSCSELLEKVWGGFLAAALAFASSSFGSSLRSLTLDCATAPPGLYLFLS
jgi:hypothetical protein